MSPEPETVEKSPKYTFIEKLKLLSNPPESARPIESVTDAEVEALRGILKASGFELDLSPNASQALGSKHFRNLSDGKGIAILESLGEDKAKSLMMTCIRLSDVSGNFPLDIYGLNLTIASFLVLAIRPPEGRALILENLNQRVFIGYTEAEQQMAKEAFVNVPPVENPDKASIQVGGVMKIWNAIVDLSK